MWLMMVNKNENSYENRDISEYRVYRIRTWNKMNL